MSRNLLWMPKLLSVGLSLSLNISLYSQSCQDASVELNAEISTNPPSITLHWMSNSSTTQYTVTRKLKVSGNWPAPIATLQGDATAYTDTLVNVGTSYEYRLIRTGNTYTGYGYINAGIEVPAVESRGNLILVVDQTFSVSLQPEINQWIEDAVGDGWRVTTIEADRNATAAEVKDQIKQVYDASSPKAKCVFILGHVPVPYSGDLNPDGHPDHLGAWPTDTYYGDMNGVWTDAAVNDTVAGDPRNRNIPGDGKFDQSQIPSDIELQVGRVDFANMPAFALNEEELLRNYLNKDHAFRQKMFTAVYRGLVDDNFGYFSGEAFASTGYKNMGPIVGPENVVAGDYFTALGDSTYLWSYGCGGGWYQGAGGIGSTADFANASTKTVFTMLFGSYFGDWDSQNNFLRAPLAQGWTLTNAWSGRPHWVFHHMALGENIGYCARLTQNNSLTYFPSYGARFVSINLMGDPTLRNDIIAPVSKLQAINEGYGVQLSWEPSPDPVMGYQVYRKTEPEDDFVRLNENPVAENEFTDDCLEAEGEIIYMVRAYQLQQTHSGSYYNMSEGVMETIQHDSLPDVTADGTFILEGQDVSFMNHSTGAVDHILWLFGDGESSEEENPVHHYDDGAYTAALIVSNACKSDTLYLNVLILTGTKEIPADQQIRVWPNPAHNEVNLSLTTALPGGFQLKVYSMDGKLVLENKKAEQQVPVRIEQLNPGIYTVLVVQDGKRFWQRILVE
jgi:hypothetical protein